MVVADLDRFRSRAPEILSAVPSVDVEVLTSSQPGDPVPDLTLLESGGYRGFAAGPEGLTGVLYPYPEAEPLR